MRQNVKKIPATMVGMGEAEAVEGTPTPAQKNIICLISYVVNYVWQKDTDLEMMVSSQARSLKVPRLFEEVGKRILLYVTQRVAEIRGRKKGIVLIL